MSMHVPGASSAAGAEQLHAAPTGSNSADLASWQAVAGKSAPAFQQVAAVVGDGPWRQYKLQVGALLLLHYCCLRSRPHWLHMLAAALLYACHTAGAIPGCRLQALPSLCWALCPVPDAGC